MSRSLGRRILCAASLAAAACGAGTAGAADEPLGVAVSIAPQRWLVERIGGPRVAVTVLVPAGADPHVFEPTARQMTALAHARLLFAVGMPFEPALVPRLRAVNPRLRVVDVRGERQRESDGHGGGEDPHTWLDVRQAMGHARVMAAALAAEDPGGRAAYEAGLNGLLRELAALDDRLHATLAAVKGRSFLVLHPAWGHFAGAYGLVQRAVEQEGKPPSARQLARLVDGARAEGVRAVFVEPQFSPRAARALANEIGADVVVIDPLSADYAANLERVARTLAEWLAP